MEQKVSILVVEDDDSIRDALKDFLEFHEFKVAVAVDGLEAQRVVLEAVGPVTPPLHATIHSRPALSTARSMTEPT